MSSKSAKNQAPASIPNEFRLVWLDMEMTGLNPEVERIIEVAVVVTEPDLTIVAEGPVLVIHQSDDILNAMDKWNKGTHGKSGLIDKVKASTLTETQAEDELIAFLKQHVPAGKSPLCGNTVSQDRRFMYKYMPKFEQFFHYRTIDVSTLKELARRWRPELLKGFEKRSKHEALADIHESIDELKYYREHFINLPDTLVG
ncbi:oligoribonuclease [Jezberella montanilacus]|jgi:oligoribonuclease|uniref:Oligoribonuclease n=1 Tax=Jezberella montanilacus TaxID=323426 RepID=A0A2T0XK05_9BURK|nr:oligoribonuclease [Jezberella montanilacus]PRY99278.1 oligoribonuclease [Jezberella montanilacus]